MSDKIMDRIQALLDKAAATDFDAERKTYEEKAQELMDIHRLTEAAMRAHASAKGDRSRPTRSVPMHEKIVWVPESDEFLETHMRVVRSLLELTGCKVVYLGDGRIHLFGYPDSIAYFRMLWLSSYLTFSSKLFPEWDRSATAGENIRWQAEAGLKWTEIWYKARKEGQPFMRKAKGTNDMIEVACPPDDNGWMKRQMAQAYAATGEEKPKLTHGRQNYRDSFARGFYEAMSHRVYAMIGQKNAREREAGSGVGLVLASDANALETLFNEVYPQWMLGSASTGRSVRGNHGAALGRGGAAARAVDMSSGSRVGGGQTRGEIG